MEEEGNKWTLSGGSVKAAVGRIAAKQDIRERGWLGASTPQAASSAVPACKCLYIQLWRLYPLRTGKRFLRAGD